MANYTIPCDTFVRLATLANSPSKYPASPWIKSVRVENGIAIASNRALIVVERLPAATPPETIHIKAEPVLVAKCAAEIKYHSNLFIAEVVGMGSAKTTLGYIHPGDALAKYPDANELDEWRSKVPSAAVKKPLGAMMWDAELIAALGAASPSGRIVFPSIIDATQPIVVRDPVDPNWFGMFLSQRPDAMQQPAIVPEWFV